MSFVSQGIMGVAEAIVAHVVSRLSRYRDSVPLSRGTPECAGAMEVEPDPGRRRARSRGVAALQGRRWSRRMRPAGRDGRQAARPRTSSRARVAEAMAGCRIAL